MNHVESSEREAPDPRRRRILATLAGLAVSSAIAGLAFHAADTEESSGPSAATPEVPERPRRAPPTFNPSLVPHDFAPVTEPPPSSAHCTDLDDAPPPRMPSLRRGIETRTEEVVGRLRALMADPALTFELRAALGLTLRAEATEWERGLVVLRKTPARFYDGFDVLADVELALAARTLRSAPLRARELVRDAIRLAPDQVLPHLIDIAASEAVHDEAAAARAAERAFALAPTDPLIASERYWHVDDGVDVPAAIVALDAYLRANPWDLWAARRRAQLEARRIALGDVVIRTHAGVSSAVRRDLDDVYTVQALTTTATALDDAAELLGVPRRPSLALFVYGTHRELIEVTCMQEWTGALYDGAVHVPAELLAYPELAENMLRHEALHAAMAYGARLAGPTASSPPVWFREGVAQYFSDGVTPESERTFELLTREHTYVSFPSMVGPFAEIEDGTDASVAYHQALAMVLYLVERRGERGIAAAMDHLERGGDPDTILASVGAPLDGEMLLSFLEERTARLSRWAEGMEAVTGAH